MADCGDTFRSNLPPRHIWVIISDPNAHSGKFVFVNLTTLTDKCVDDSCILEPKDYQPFLTHQTTVAYSRFHFGDAAGMEDLVQSQMFIAMPPIPQPTLRKIIVGGRASPHLPPAAKKMLPP
jgi:hypothetical protein